MDYCKEEATLPRYAMHSADYAVTSVRPSLRLSHTGITWKQLDVFSKFSIDW